MLEYWRILLFINLNTWQINSSTAWIDWNATELLFFLCEALRRVCYFENANEKQPPKWNVCCSTERMEYFILYILPTSQRNSERKENKIFRWSIYFRKTEIVWQIAWYKYSRITRKNLNILYGILRQSERLPFTYWIWKVNKLWTVEYMNSTIWILNELKKKTEAWNMLQRISK